VPLAYLSPFTNEENAYIERQKELLREIGFSVVPFRATDLLKGGVVGLFSRENVVLVHWLENRAFSARSTPKTLSGPGLAGLLLYMGLLAVTRARVVYFMHNHVVHDIAPRYLGLSRRLVGLLGSIADLRVVHDPSCARQYDAAYLPHPLYREVSRRRAVSPANDGRSARPLRFAIVGAVRRYKGIEGVLRLWPHGKRLLICGRGEATYVAELQHIIATRGLAEWVTLSDRFLRERELVELLTENEVTILPHAAGTNLVSGAFFEAIGSAVVILARSTSFFQYVTARFRNVLTFASDEDLALRLAQIELTWPELAKLDVADVAEREFGWETCKRAYRDLLLRPSLSREHDAQPLGVARSSPVHSTESRTSSCARDSR
jgi:beta-1,4-mannosyltransferase